MIAIGDIAGQFDAFMRLVDRLPPEKFLVLLGDLNDRGPKSREVIAWAMDNQHRCLVLDSNHGDMFVDYVYNTGRYDKDVFYWNGGAATMASYGINIDNDQWRKNTIPDELVRHTMWLKHKPSHLIKEINGQKYMFSHAPMCPNPHRTFADWLKRGSLNDGDNGHIDFNFNYMWNRNEPFEFHRELPDTISVFGHNSGRDLKLICGQFLDGIYIKDTTHLKELLDINMGEVYGICLDTSRDKKLCALDFDTMEVYYEAY